ncbi:electron transfer flavoprotein subunit alpha/FixB family protein [Pengzhenrongella sicca]|uniref:Electron transfer flavoprotein subunit alpha/FixB family protein n=1 Tax=Pengzhenrongella sicca TaxID=2819238 RepID=A0A8A4Z9Y6_9MICO|nr:electron transfer flavoprotein subunit alpha/FixB family protein [Pengzhenrongella sicca]QTE28722.1 electron transfer flavoprotein subunit alpha/FixB family protein [Pengzhenrongella sicca]
MTETATVPALVLLDQHEGRLRPPVLELLTAARALGAPVHGVWFGGGLENVRATLGEAGVERVYRVTLGPAGEAAADAHLTPVVAEVLAELAIAHESSLLLLTSTFENKEVAARVGVLTGAGVVVDAGGLAIDDGRVVADKTVFAGSWTTRCAITTPLAVVALKANSVPAEAAPAPTSPEVVLVSPVVSAHARAVTLEQRTERPTSGRPDLSEAQVVVAGGRGTNGDFGPLEELADVLGGAVGATRVATDEGWIAHEAQIGQTGVTVAPRLYIGAGVSGAVHHRGGMQAAGTIVAINSDPESPIFEIADFGIVGDLFQVLPQVTAELRRLEG